MSASKKLTDLAVLVGEAGGEEVDLLLRPLREGGPECVCDNMDCMMTSLYFNRHYNYEIVEVRDYWYRTYTYRYYGYNDTTEIVIELTDIFP